MSEKRAGGLKEMRERISSYHVYDRHYERVGKVDDLFVDANDELEYIGLKLGGLFSSKTALIPMELVRINDRRDLIEIEADKRHIEDSPTFSRDDEITPAYEDSVHRHFALQMPPGERSAYGDYDTQHRPHIPDRDPSEVDTEYGERAGSEDERREPLVEEHRDAAPRDSIRESDRPVVGASGEKREVSSDRPRIRKRVRISARPEDGGTGYSTR